MRRELRLREIEDGPEPYPHPRFLDREPVPLGGEHTELGDQQGERRVVHEQARTDQFADLRRVLRVVFARVVIFHLAEPFGYDRRRHDDHAAGRTQALGEGVPVCLANSIATSVFAGAKSQNISRRNRRALSTLSRETSIHTAFVRTPSGPHAISL